MVWKQMYWRCFLAKLPFETLAYHVDPGECRPEIPHGIPIVSAGTGRIELAPINDRLDPKNSERIQYCGAQISLGLPMQGDINSLIAAARLHAHTRANHHALRATLRAE